MYIRPALLCLALLQGWSSFSGEPPSQRYLFEGVSVGQKGIVISIFGSLKRVTPNSGKVETLTEDHRWDRTPVCHPNGRYIAFMRTSAQGGDIMLLDGETGTIRQLTFHPSQNWPLTWSNDGKKLLFASRRDMGPSPRLYEIGIEGGWPQALPLRMGSDGTWLPDGRLIYVPHSKLPQFREFRYYRGGIMSPLWLVQLENGNLEELTQAKSNAYQPRWSGQQLYYLDDATGTANLYSRSLGASAPKQLTEFQTYGIRAFDARDSKIAFTRHGRLFLWEPSTDQPRDITPTFTMPTRHTRTRTVNARRWLEDLSWTRAETLCLSARGDVFLRDLEGATSKNITQTSGIAERQGQLSPDGRYLAYFSDARDGYALVIRDIQSGQEQRIAVEPHPSLYEELTWSPDNQQLCFSSRRLMLWHFKLGDVSPNAIATSQDAGQIAWRPAWSPDGALLAYQKRVKHGLPSIFIFDGQAQTHHRVTPGDIHTTQPHFDASGRYLYFLASPQAPASDFHWGLLSATQARPGQETYLAAAMLFPGDRMPLIGAQPNLDLDWERLPSGATELETLSQRVVYLNVGQHQILRLWPGTSGVLYLLKTQWREAPHLGVQPIQNLYRLNLRNPQAMERLARDVSRVLVHPSGDQILYESHAGWRKLRREKGAWQREAFSIGTLAKPVEPREEWGQLFEESWRIAQEMFYDPQLHGQDVEALGEDYRTYLASVSHRRELSLLLKRMLGHLSVSHIQVGDGDSGRGPENGRIGFLGAAMETTQNRYRFSQVYRQPPLGLGHPEDIAPLDQPGSRVSGGEYLLAIDDLPLFADENLHERLWQRAGQWVWLTVGPKPDGQASRRIRIRALASDADARRAHWVNRNRAKVAELSDGKVGYLYVGGYNSAGIRNFLQGYFAQKHMRGLIIDQRDNGGGTTSDALIELITREPLYAYRFRQGTDLQVPVNASSGSKVLINNFWNASAAETFALMFQNARVGTIVGNATFGAGIGPWGWRHQLVDGSRIQVPNRAAYHPNGHWGIENMGIKPDVPVSYTPQWWQQGRDPYLEAAVKAALQGKAPKRDMQAPTFPIHPR